jgi:pimeloyl-ACP methyl ester carboxylesterase
MNSLVRVSSVLSVILCILEPTFLRADQEAAKNSAGKGIEGTWQGTLKVGAVEFRLAYKISKKPNGSLAATMDSIDTGAKDIPADEVSWKDPTLRLELKKIKGVFEGKTNKDYSEIEGKWQQSGQSFSLTLRRVDKLTELKRPQEPKKPYPYVEEEVNYENRSPGVRLAGTLTLPKGSGPFPAVLLIAGSGPHNRNEEVLGHKVFLVLADYLTRRGIAVLRSDKRGIGKSTGKYEEATSADFADDALAGVEYLRGRKEINPRQIGLIGHSEGGIVAPMVAARSKDVAFIVLMAGTGVNGEEILYRQTADTLKVLGADEKSLSKLRKILERSLAVLKQEKDNAAAENKIRAVLAEEFSQLAKEEKKRAESQKAMIEDQIQLLILTAHSLPWMRFFLTYDPKPTLMQVHCPVLAINGEKDLQIAVKVNLPAIEEALRAGGNRYYTIKELPNLNHIFQTCKTGAISEYGQIEETIAPAALQLIGDWILNEALRYPAGKGIEGTWQGTIKAGVVDLRVAFKINKKPDGSFTATMDSIDQRAKDIPVDEVTWQDPALRFELKKIMGAFAGKANKDYSEIEGKWQQSGQSFPLTLKRIDKPTELKRPQEPKKPYPYVEEEVSYEKPRAGVKLAGTLTLPKGNGPFPAVLLIAGSGPHTRNEEVFGHKVFLVLADYLTRRGIAVLRSDKRGIGKSTGKYDEATSADFADDALAGVEYLKGRKEINPRQIGLIGHSEGGLVAPMVAARSKDVAFIVLMAGTGINGEEILYRQGADILKVAGTDDKGLAKQRKIQERMFAVVKQEKDTTVAEKKLREVLAEEFSQLTEEEKKKAESQKAAVESQMKLLLTPWIRFFLAYDPKPTLMRVLCPVLAINGEKDLQVAAKVNLPVIEEALRAGGNRHYTIKELPNLNHLFQTSKTGAISEYGQIEETIAPVALQLMGDWILNEALRYPADFDRPSEQFSGPFEQISNGESRRPLLERIRWRLHRWRQ